MFNGEWLCRCSFAESHVAIVWVTVFESVVAVSAPTKAQMSVVVEFPFEQRVRLYKRAINEKTILAMFELLTLGSILHALVFVAIHNELQDLIHVAFGDVASV